MNKPADLAEVLPAKSCGKQYQMMASNTSFVFFMSGLHILLLPRCTTVRSQHYTDSLISTRMSSCAMCVCVCVSADCKIVLLVCLFIMYSALTWTCPCLVHVMWTCDEVGWPFGLEEWDVSPLYRKPAVPFADFQYATNFWAFLLLS